MKKTYIKPEVITTSISTSILAGSPQTDDNTKLDNWGSSRSRYQEVEWLDEEDI